MAAVAVATAPLLNLADVSASCDSNAAAEDTDTLPPLSFPVLPASSPSASVDVVPTAAVEVTAAAALNTADATDRCASTAAAEAADRLPSPAFPGFSAPTSSTSVDVAPTAVLVVTAAAVLNAADASAFYRLPSPAPLVPMVTCLSLSEEVGSALTGAGVRALLRQPAVQGTPDHRRGSGRHHPCGEGGQPELQAEAAGGGRGTSETPEHATGARKPEGYLSSETGPRESRCHAPTWVAAGPPLGRRCGGME